jgi:hypothetical protein
MVFEINAHPIDRPTLLAAIRGYIATLTDHNPDARPQNRCRQAIIDQCPKGRQSRFVHLMQGDRVQYAIVFTVDRTNGMDSMRDSTAYLSTDLPDEI